MGIETVLIVFGLVLVLAVTGGTLRMKRNAGSHPSPKNDRTVER